LSKGCDTAALADIHASAFAEAWTALALNDLLAAVGTFAFAADAGFILVRVVGGEAEILTLAVRPASRRRGLGAALVCAAANHAQSLGAAVLFLEVACHNDAARKLYTGLGFSEVGRRPGYYRLGPDKREDALILRGNLPLPPLGKRPAAG
jgi:ribosomal-protein-alanine N-acetyltransferase